MAPGLAVTHDSTTGATRSLLSRGGYLTTEKSTADAMTVALEFVTAYAAHLGLTPADLGDYEVTDEVYSAVTGATHIYLRQVYLGLPVYNGQLHINVSRDGRIMSVNNTFMPDIAAAADSDVPALSAEDAVTAAANHLEIQLNRPPKIIATDLSPAGFTTLRGGNISRSNIEARLMWLPIRSGDARLVWNFQVATLDGRHVYDLTVDAASGQVWTRFDWVDNDSYLVFPAPIESPNHSPAPPPSDGRREVFDPADALVASPYGWHDTDGLPGAEFTSHRGNNVHAYDDINDTSRGLCTSTPSPPGGEPNCGGSLICDFDFPIDFATQDPFTYTSAAVTNLFYWNNLIHDIQYRYGFDEAAGNFQQNNYGNSGLQADYVLAEAQDGSGLNNANFCTPPDGQRPRMQMFLWSLTSPRRDGDFDNGIILHEYGHGISNRLVGGPSSVSCLRNAQQPGEGLSDWWSLVYTAKSTDGGADGRGIGTYALGHATNGPGIRTQRYSTDPTINTHTYASISGMAIPHGVGEVWAQAAWEVYWALVDTHGFDPDLTNALGGSGNQRAMLYVNEGLKNTICSPTFIDVRDGIILAATSLGGEDVCLLWEAFAAFGLGTDAVSGGPASTTPTNGFAVPAECAGGPAPPPNDPPIAVVTAMPKTGDAPLTVNFSSAGSFDPDGSITTFDWNFGDGNRSTLESPPAHTYNSAGRFQAVLTVTDDGGATHSNSVRITVTDPAPSADLKVAIADAPDPVTAGGRVTYSVTVTNNGLDGATGVTLGATLPGNVTLLSATPSQGTCGPAVSCALGALAPAATATVAIVVTADAAGTVTFPVSVAGNENDPDTTNDTATASTTVDATVAADLAVAIADAPDPVTVGGRVTYSVTVTNNGLDGATGVTLGATLPGNVTLLSATPSQGRCDTAVSCALGALAPAAMATVDIVVTADAAGTITYPVSVAGAEGDPDGTNNTDTTTTTVDGTGGGVPLDIDKAEWKVDKSELRVKGLGADAGAVVEIRDAATGAMVGNAVAASDGKWRFRNRPGPDEPVPCAVTAGTGGASGPARAVRDAPRPCGSAPTGADLAVTIADAPDPFVVGENINYILTVTNNGPEGATGVILSATLPANVTLVSRTPSQGTCDTDPAVSCDLGALAPGISATATVDIVVTADAAGTIIYPVSVAGAEGDPNGTNNTDTTTTTVDGTGGGVPLDIDKAEWKVDKSELRVKGRGADAGALVEIRDAATGAMVGNAVAASDGRWRLKTRLGPNDPMPCAVTAGTGGASGPATAVRNAARICGSAPTGADLSITKTDSLDPVEAGTSLTYTIVVRNNGPADAQDVTATDTLPAGVTLAGTSGCDNDPTGVSDCMLGTIPAGSSKAYEIRLTVDPGTSGTITNNASVTSTTPEAKPGDEATFEDTTVGGTGGGVPLDIDKAEWKVDKSELRVKGRGADAGAVVEIRDAATGAMVGNAVAASDGRWRLKTRLGPNGPVPCAVTAGIDGASGPATAVRDAPAGCV